MFNIFITLLFKIWFIDYCQTMNHVDINKEIGHWRSTAPSDRTLERARVSEIN
jgi:hypothetical protein